MELPNVPTPTRIGRLSFSQYQAGLLCLARLAAATTKPRPLIPTTPSSLLGVAFHEVMRRGHTGRLSPASDDLSSARWTFDEVAKELWDAAHPLIRLKYRDLERLPFYFQKREQAATLAASLAAPSRKRSPTSNAAPSGAEVWLESQDGKLFGRADYLDAGSNAVIDYKTGMLPVDQSASAVEQRQLRFYGHLAHETGTPVNKGQIVRADGSIVEVQLAKADIDDEGKSARAVLNDFCTHVDNGASFADLAAPTSNSCTGCDARPYCDRYWQMAQPSWAKEGGTHLEGNVDEVRPVNLQGARLVTLKLSGVRGTIEGPEVEVEQIPVDWLGVAAPENLLGKTVRVVDARAMETRPGVVRADKAGTTVWHASTL
jgi:hypothetical protein